MLLYNQEMHCFQKEEEEAKRSKESREGREILESNRIYFDSEGVRGGGRPQGIFVQKISNIIEDPCLTLLTFVSPLFN